MEENWIIKQNESLKFNHERNNGKYEKRIKKIENRK